MLFRSSPRRHSASIFLPHPTLLLPSSSPSISPSKRCSFSRSWWLASHFQAGSVGVGVFATTAGAGAACSSAHGAGAKSSCHGGKVPTGGWMGAMEDCGASVARCARSGGRPACAGAGWGLWWRHGTLSAGASHLRVAPDVRLLKVPPVKVPHFFLFVSSSL